ncbi:MAG TPA: exopolysaccharide biosynthesis polyprenyl glycosylphosphotransferase [Patescibacteria group bacterium]|nr:exopolysaccharide biosynthesis polyprenyl glycosylphosphotransferase [Patescibacteria group bacterium]
MKGNFKKIAVLLGDIIVLHSSLMLTLIIRYGANNFYEVWLKHWPSFAIIFFIWIIVFYIYNLYNLILAADKLKFNQLALNAILTSALLSVAFFYLNPATQITPKTNLALFIIITIALFILWRKFFNALLQNYLPKNNLLLIAKKDKIESLVNYIQTKTHLGFNTALILEETLSGEELKDIIQTKRIHTIVLDPTHAKAEAFRKLLFKCLPYNLIFTDLSSFYEKITGKVSIDTITHTWFLENFNEGEKKYFNHIKRIYDLIMALIIFLITLPLWLIIAVIIILDSGLPIFFKQKRLGKNGAMFQIIKFRTMKNEEITKAGSFLRKTRLDELPQLLNILQGKMSFIGPRPEQPSIVEKLKEQIPFYQERLLIKPGLSGWDQISENYHSASYKDSFEKLQYDLFYIKNRSIYLDFSITLKTISTILRRKGK